LQHFINLISPFTLHVSAFIGHLQVFYFLAKTVTCVAIYYSIKIYLKISFLKFFVMIFSAPCHACFCFCCGLLDPRAWCRRYVCLMLLFQRLAYPSQCVWFIHHKTNVTAAPGTGINQPTTKAKTGVTRCGENHDEKFKKRNF
jgi:hypothetical protein